MPKKDTKQYIATDSEGKEYEVSNLNIFCKERGLWPGNMRKVARGQAKYSKGWKCRYAATAPGEAKKLLDSKKLSETDQIHDDKKKSAVLKTKVTEPLLNDNFAQDSKFTVTPQKELSIPVVDIEETFPKPMNRFLRFILILIAIFFGMMSFAAFISIFEDGITKSDIIFNIILCFVFAACSVALMKKKSKKIKKSIASIKKKKSKTHDKAKSVEKEEPPFPDILISEKAKNIWKESNKFKLFGAKSELHVEQGEFSHQDSLKSLENKGYAGFLKIRERIVLFKEDSLINKTYFILFDLNNNMPIVLEPIVKTQTGEVAFDNKIALLAKIYCYSMSNDLIIDKNEKVGIVTIINGFNYDKNEVRSAKRLAMFIMIREMLSDNLIAKDENAILDAFRQSLDITKKDDLFINEMSISAKLAKLYHNKEYDVEKLNNLRKTAKKLGCLTLELAGLIDQVAMEWFTEQCLEGKLPIVDININLKKNEEAYLALPVEVLQQKTVTKTLRGYIGTRIKIKKLPPIYLGGSMPKKIEKEVIKKIGIGTLYVTNDRVVLSGTKTNYSIWYDKILQVVIYRDAIQINYEGRYGGRFYLVEQPKICGTMINALISRKDS